MSSYYFKVQTQPLQTSLVCLGQRQNITNGRRANVKLITRHIQDCSFVCVCHYLMTVVNRCLVLSQCSNRAYNTDSPLSQTGATATTINYSPELCLLVYLWGWQLRPEYMGKWWDAAALVYKLVLCPNHTASAQGWRISGYRLHSKSMGPDRVGEMWQQWHCGFTSSHCKSFFVLLNNLSASVMFKTS